MKLVILFFYLALPGVIWILFGPHFVPLDVSNEGEGTPVVPAQQVWEDLLGTKPAKCTWDESWPSAQQKLQPILQKRRWNFLLRARKSSRRPRPRRKE